MAAEKKKTPAKKTSKSLPSANVRVRRLVSKLTRKINAKGQKALTNNPTKQLTDQRSTKVKRAAAKAAGVSYRGGNGGGGGTDPGR